MYDAGCQPLYKGEKQYNLQGTLKKVHRKSMYNSLGQESNYLWGGQTTIWANTRTPLWTLPMII